MADDRDGKDGPAAGAPRARPGSKPVAVPLRRRNPAPDQDEAMDARIDGELRAAGIDPDDLTPKGDGEPAPGAPAPDVSPGLLGEADMPPYSEPPPPPEPPPQPAPARSRPARMGLRLFGVLLLIGLIAGGGYYGWHWAEERQRAEALGLASAEAIRAGRAYLAGDLAGARRLAQASLANAAAAGTPDAAPLAEAVLGRLALADGRTAEARDFFERLAARFTPEDAPLSLALAEEGLARIALETGDALGAADRFRAAAGLFTRAGQPGRAQAALAQALRAAAQADDPAVAAEALESLADEARARGDVGALAEALAALAELARRMDAPDLVARLELAADAATEAGDARAAAQLSLRAAEALAADGRPADALARLRDALALVAAEPLAGDLRRDGYARAAALARQLGRFREERLLRAEAVAAAREAGSREALSALLEETATRDLAIGFFAEALSAGLEAAEAAEDAGQLRRAALALAQVALARLRQGDPDGAEEALDRARRLADGLDDPSLTAFLGVYRGLIAANRGALDAALSAYEQAGLVFERLGETRNRSAALLNAGDALWRAGRHGQAEARLDDAERLALESDFAAARDFVLEQRGQIALDQGREIQALALLGTALDAHRAAGRLYNAAVLAFQLGGLAEQADDPDLAALRYEEAQALFAELGLNDRAIAAQTARAGVRAGP